MRFLIDASVCESGRRPGENLPLELFDPDYFTLTVEAATGTNAVRATRVAAARTALRGRRLLDLLTAAPLALALLRGPSLGYRHDQPS
jgi:hypothetical protein